MSLKARALYSFQSVNEEEISFQEKEELFVLNESPVDGWLKGENSWGQRGLVPASYIEIIPQQCDSNLTDSSVSSAGSPDNDSAYFPPTAYLPCHPQHSYDSTPHRQQSYDSAPYRQHSYDSTPHPQHSYDSTPHRQHSYDSTPHRQQSYDSAPHRQQSYDSAPHTQHNYDSAPHTQHSYDSTPHPQHSYDSAPHRQHRYDSAPHPQHSYESAPHTQHNYDSAPHTQHSYDSTPHRQHSYDSAPHTQHSYDSTPHPQHSYDSAPRRQHRYDSAPHPQHSYESAPHTQHNYDSAPHTQHSYDSTPHRQHSYDSTPHRQHSYDSALPMQQVYDDDDDDDDWDDWEDSSTAVDEEDPRQGGGANGHTMQSWNSRYWPKPHMERRDSTSSTRKGSTVGRNLNRFSSFVRSGVEAFVLGDVPMMAKIAESYSIEMGPWGPQWQESPQPFSCSVEDPTKQTKFKGIKTYISYRVKPSHTGRAVHRRYKHFDWLYNRLLHKFTVISVPHLPEKQATGRFDEDFIEKRKRRLVLWMDHMTSHPVLSRYEGFEHFLMCSDDKQWKLGKRRAEKDEMVGAHFMLTFQIPNEHQDLQDVEERVDSFKAFARKMEDSVLQLILVATELARKHMGGFRKEFQKLGNAFLSVSQAFTLDPPHCSHTLSGAIAHTGRTYQNIGEMFAEQPKEDLFHMLDMLSLYQGLLDNFPDIIHLQKGKQRYPSMKQSSLVK
ncbi:hypothetical protein JZ751_019542 [Albula glossodonta]|uniref:Sorting nexin-33 n=1 Tax=Albula glossodonta TaxID=121402 RepID=A0A8T2MT61_9TELE|nr:hypothetical protein JZ751_019542 [Albula glossodonta]